MSATGVTTGRRLLKVTRVGRNSRTTIPSAVRMLLNLREGDRVAWIFEDGRIVVEKHGGSENSGEQGSQKVH